MLLYCLKLKKKKKKAKIKNCFKTKHGRIMSFGKHAMCYSKKSING